MIVGRSGLKMSGSELKRVETDGSVLQLSGIGWEWVGVDESRWEWIGMDGSGWEYMIGGGSGWNWVGVGGD